MEYKVKCKGGTEYYCNTCKHDLCLHCKERHVIDLHTKHHDVVINREKYEDRLRLTPCVRHPTEFIEKWCYSCSLPICVQCTRNSVSVGVQSSTERNLCEENSEHNLWNIDIAYVISRKLNRKTNHNIRSETLYNSFFLLADIKSDMKTFHKEIFYRQSEMSSKAQRLKDLIDTVICDVKNKQQKKQMIKQLTSIEKYEHISQQSLNRQVKFLFFLKKTSVPKVDITSYCIQHAHSKDINMEYMVKLLSEIQIIETGKRQVQNEGLSTSVLHITFLVRGVSAIRHISCVTSDRIWICGMFRLILTNLKGKTLNFLTNKTPDCHRWSYGIHTVDIISDLIYIDTDGDINKLSKDTKERFTLIKKTESWKPCSVFSSPLTGDLLVGMLNTDTDTGKLNRYNNAGQYIETIQHGNKGQELYGRPIYITENRNWDVVVSDFNRGLVVTNCGGRYRFSYTGPPTGSILKPRGVCTDALLHILVCDESTDTVQMIDKDGCFLSLIQIEQQEIHRPRTLSYDNKNHLLFVGSYDDNKVCAYKYVYLKRQDFVPGDCNRL
ncbi:uncharacterized protein LOC133180656 [Saccostrea echinata]|uniref:uncharacterized protein LOC133180656 n=1 Tax=Saccostrea echinata TaxID=191078 RepID=UPI002A82F030|nr:uncharacterized protein LOC133180656 [Saccostrea echinata]